MVARLDGQPSFNTRACGCCGHSLKQSIQRGQISWKRHLGQRIEPELHPSAHDTAHLSLATKRPSERQSTPKNKVPNRSGVVELVGNDTSSIEMEQESQRIVEIVAGVLVVVVGLGVD